MLNFVDFQDLLLKEKALAFSAAGGLLLCLLFSRFRRHTFKDIPGPKPEYIWGTVHKLLGSEYNTTEKAWNHEFGTTYRISGPLDERLVTIDPTALHHIFTSGNFDRGDVNRVLTYLLAGPGILWAQGDTHKRQRRVMQPAFGVTELKALVPLFTVTAQRLAETWKKQAEANNSDFTVLDVSGWLARATLDVIGHAAFDYNFDAIDNPNEGLARTFSSFSQGPGRPSGLTLLFQNVFKRIPDSVANFFVRYLPMPGLARLRDTGNHTKAAAADLVEKKKEEQVTGNGGKDIMSLLVKANLTTNEKLKLRNDELLAQMATIILAGHETTATSLTWTLYLLSQRPDIQVKLRDEIAAAREQAATARGSPELLYSDFEAMHYFTAFIKEMLRFFPAIRMIVRQAKVDDVIPLLYPVKTANGTVKKEIAVSKGQLIVIDINSYNRLKEVWGEDADEFKPERWFDDSSRKATGLGVYANLMTFGMGARNCIGWRFSLIEMQCFLVELLTAFEFAPPPNARRIKAEGFIRTALVEGEEFKGRQMPLTLKVVGSE